MFGYLLEDNDGKVKSDIQNIIRDCRMEEFTEFTERDFLFIKEMIDKPKDLDQEVNCAIYFKEYHKLFLNTVWPYHMVCYTI